MLRRSIAACASLALIATAVSATSASARYRPAPGVHYGQIHRFEHQNHYAFGLHRYRNPWAPAAGLFALPFAAAAGALGGYYGPYGYGYPGYGAYAYEPGYLYSPTCGVWNCW